ncbi:hypothetical protein M0R19_01400 [Candidatus Pacearchaeota archaeon]|nr:hypothetical protein [Candidatus Pacearchaeota archaeon]
MNKRAIFILVLIIFPFVSADVVSINSGGDSGLIINPDNFIEGFFGCIPTTCAKLGYNCDSWSDGCAKTINCGSCASGFTCTSGTCVAIPSEEEPSTGPGGGGGGGGGGVEKKLTELKVIPEDFNLATDADGITYAKISLINLRHYDLPVTISLTSKLGDIISFEDAMTFTLGADEVKIMQFKITSPSEAGIYTGRITFKSNNDILHVPFILNVRSGKSLFDISIDIPEAQRTIFIGNKIIGQINLIQMGIKEPVDISMNYIIKDFDDNIYKEESETIMVYDQKSYEHEFNTQELPVGKYIIGAEVIYSGGVATASYPFEVIEKTVTKIQWTYIILIISLLIGIVLILIILNYYKRQNLKYKRIKQKR